MNDVAPDSGTFRLIYRSHSLIPDEQRKVELGEIFSTARSNNKKQNVTGALLLDGEWFVQALEGDENTVKALYDVIAQDSRHDSVSLIDTSVVPDRVFAKWSMARVAADGDSDIPLIAHTDGIHRAHRQSPTPEQDELLAVMRSKAREASSSVT